VGYQNALEKQIVNKFDLHHRTEVNRFQLPVFFHQLAVAFLDSTHFTLKAARKNYFRIAAVDFLLSSENSHTSVSFTVNRVVRQAVGDLWVSREGLRCELRSGLFGKAPTVLMESLIHQHVPCFYIHFAKVWIGSNYWNPEGRAGFHLK
jgi:hypothetical protein